jgi:hypothetical protein
MACPTGYIEVNGDCVYAFGNASGVSPDGTPLPQNQGGGFWDWVNKNLPDILVTAGSVWQSSRQQNQSPAPAGNAQPSLEQQNKMPVWGWILLALAGIVLLFLLLRRRQSVA